MSMSFLARGLRARPCLVPQTTGFAVLPQQLRSFTPTPASSNSRVIFDEETSSQALNKVLANIQNYIILPSFLPPMQRRRVFLAKLKDRLRTDPVILEIDGIQHRFPYIARSDLPETRRVVLQAVSLMETKEDWANFSRLIVGVHGAGRGLPHTAWVKIIRYAGQRGQIYCIIDAARQSARTGLKLNAPERVHELLFWVQKRAIDADWDEKVTAQSLRWIEIIIELLHDEAHHPGEKEKTALSVPLFKDPLVLGAALHLAAAQAVMHRGGLDPEGKVARLARLLLAVWPAGTKGTRELYPESAYTGDPKRGSVRYLWSGRSHRIGYGANLLHGLQLAAQVVEPQLAEQLRERAAGLEPDVKDLVNQTDGLPAERGLQIYDRLFGDGAERRASPAASASTTQAATEPAAV